MKDPAWLCPVNFCSVWNGLLFISFLSTTDYHYKFGRSKSNFQDPLHNTTQRLSTSCEIQWTHYSLVIHLRLTSWHSAQPCRYLSFSPGGSTRREVGPGYIWVPYFGGWGIRRGQRWRFPIGLGSQLWPLCYFFNHSAAICHRIVWDAQMNSGGSLWGKI